MRFISTFRIRGGSAGIVDAADLCSQILKPGVPLHSWTDVEEYFGVISALMDHHADFESESPPDESAPQHDMDYRTSFERKKRQAGFPIYRGCWRRRPIGGET